MIIIKMEEVQKLFNDNSGIVTALALIISLGALIVAIKALKLKCGNKVIGYYNIARSYVSSTPFIREVVLQNMKDKEVAIHEMYIRFGKNIYLDLLNKGHYDYYIHVLPPLGTLQFKFGPAYRYVSGMETVDMSKLIDGPAYGKIILETNTGKIEVKSIKTGWSPHGAYFKNFGIENVQMFKYYTPSSIYGNDGLNTKAIDYSSYGDKVMYLVTLSLNGKAVEYTIYDTKEPQVGKFNRIKFTQQSLQNETALRSFLEQEKEKGNVSFDTIDKIVNFKEDVIEQDKTEAKKYGSYTPKAEGWFEFCICDKLQTIWMNLKFDYENYCKDNKHAYYHHWIFKWWKRLKRK